MPQHATSFSTLLLSLFKSGSPTALCQYGTKIQNRQNIDVRVSSVGLKVIGRETVENLLFLENLFLPQELSKVPPNPRFASRKFVTN